MLPRLDVKKSISIQNITSSCKMKDPQLSNDFQDRQRLLSNPIAQPPAHHSSDFNQPHCAADDCRHGATAPPFGLPTAATPQTKNSVRRSSPFVSDQATTIERLWMLDIAI
ncbi:hypothetical protein L1987_44909 [Smallanthus sonchifolius]|uniref:Uncharacterized protein n=1 Tax=Smallanthus sonchifolius TaxID=185202 RepID=A0ACB9GQ58_9ASTR|nr:hypothetical protein L1987_44909 [Smallanthus sonchifolius]